MHNHAGTFAGSDVNAFIVYFHCDRTVLYNPTMLVVEWKKLMLVHFYWFWQTFSHICHWQQTCAQWFCYQFVSSAETNLYLPGFYSGSPAFSCSGWNLEHFTSDAREPLKDKAELMVHLRKKKNCITLKFFHFNIFHRNICRNRAVSCKHPTPAAVGFTSWPNIY